MGYPAGGQKTQTEPSCFYFIRLYYIHHLFTIECIIYIIDLVNALRHDFMPHPRHEIVGILQPRPGAMCARALDLPVPPYTGGTGLHSDEQSRSCKLQRGSAPSARPVLKFEPDDLQASNSDLFIPVYSDN